LVVVDEIQHRPDLFAVLRVLVDREGSPTRFLILGSASRDLIRQGSETLAGRIQFVEVMPFDVRETGMRHLDTLWLRGGFPRSFLSDSDDASWRRREGYIKTFLERGIPGMEQLVTHPKLGASWEGFAVEQIIRLSGVSEEEVYFWGVHNQAELDLLLFLKGRRHGAHPWHGGRWFQAGMSSQP